MKKVSAIVATIIFAGCFSASPTPQAELEANAKENLVGTYNKLLEATYGKVLKGDSVGKLSDCVAGEVVRQLSQEEKLLLGGNAKEKLSADGSSQSLASKLLVTSDVSKSAIKTCSAIIGVSKAIEKVKVK